MNKNKMLKYMQTWKLRKMPYSNMQAVYLANVITVFSLLRAVKAN